MTALEVISSNSINETKNIKFTPSSINFTASTPLTPNSSTIQNTPKKKNLKKFEFSQKIPDLATPPLSPKLPHILQIPLFSSHSLTSSTSSINSIDEYNLYTLEETQGENFGILISSPQTMKSDRKEVNTEQDVTTTDLSNDCKIDNEIKENKDKVEKPIENTNNDSKIEEINEPESKSSEEIVLSIIDDLISNDVISESINNQKQEENIQRLKEKIQKKNETLKESLKTSYKRLRLIQTKCFQTHVAQQLNNILELKEKNKLEKNEKKGTKSLNNEVSPINNKRYLDDTSVDLLTSILKSNLSADSSRSSSNIENGGKNDGVDAAVKSLLDDIQYEILKQGDDSKSKSTKNRKNKKDEKDDSATEDEDSEVEEESSRVMNNNETTIDSWNYGCANDTTNKTVKNNVNNLFEPKTVISNSKNNNSITVPSNLSKISESGTPDQVKKLTDSSNIFWTKTRAQLGSEWTRVQTKMKLLKLKTKQCDTYIVDKQNLLENFNNGEMNNHKTDKDISTTGKEQLVSSNGIENNKISKKTDEADNRAIAALSTSLQESVAAEVFSIEEIPEQTASRCLPYERTKTSRLFNLNRADLVELDDDVLKSFYYTLRYFSNTYFKTMCLCRGKDKNNFKKNNYYYQKKRKLLQKEEEANNNKDNINNENSNEDILTGNNKKKETTLKSDILAADMLSLSNTCIFCHLLKKYEQTRMENSISSMNKTCYNKTQLNGKQNSKKQNIELLALKDKRLGSATPHLKSKERNKNLVKQYLAEVDNENDNTKVGENRCLADIDIVNRDHSYCKQFSSTLSKKNISTIQLTTNDSESTIDDKKQKITNKTESNVSNERLLDELVGNRLNRIFDVQAIKTEKTETVVLEQIPKTEIVENNVVEEKNFEKCDDEIIDAGLDLTPADLQKLPDLSYEELKFLNEIELDKSTYRKKFEFADDSIDMSCESNGYNRDYTSFISDKTYSMPYQMTSELFQALNYRPKYRTLLNKKRREQKKEEQLELSQIKNDLKEDSIKRRNRKKNELLISEKTKRITTQKIPTVRPRKRQRSTSSYSSNSSIISSNYNDSNFSDSPLNQPSQKSSNYYNHYKDSNGQASKFDIDNIVIPFDSSIGSSSSSKTIFLTKQVNVPTPNWREYPLEHMVNITDDVLEELEDVFYQSLHKNKEKRKFDNSKKLKLNHEDLSTSLPSCLLSTCLSETNKKRSPTGNDNLNDIDNESKLNSSLNLTSNQPVNNNTHSLYNKLTRYEWEHRKFPLTDQDYEILIKQDYDQKKFHQKSINETPNPEDSLSVK